MTQFLTFVCLFCFVNARTLRQFEADFCHLFKLSIIWFEDNGSSIQVEEYNEIGFSQKDCIYINFVEFFLFLSNKNEWVSTVFAGPISFSPNCPVNPS